MRFLWLLIVWAYVTTNVTGADTKIKEEEFLAPKDVLPDNAAMWKKLFMKLDAMSAEIAKLSQGQAVLNKSFEEFQNQRLEDHKTLQREDDFEEAPANLSRRKRDLFQDVQKIQGLLNTTQTALMENIQVYREDFKKGQTALMTNIREYREDYNKRQDIHESMLRKSFSYNHEWTTILSRSHYGINNASWYYYKRGYSDNGFYFIGLEPLYLRTTYESSQELMIVLKDWNNQTRYAKYDLFQIGDEDEQYAIRKLGKYMGNAGDSLRPHLFQKFSTYDRDNDDNEERNCASDYGSGWWFFGNCTMSMLTGPYRYKVDSNTWGISWSSWRGWNYSLKSVEMMIRPTL